jgi:hypothetical protein
MHSVCYVIRLKTHRFLLTPSVSKEAQLDHLPSLCLASALPDSVFLSLILGNLAFLKVVWHFNFSFGLSPISPHFLAVFWIFPAHLNRKGAY